MALAGIAVTEADGQIFLRVQPDAQRPAVDPAALHVLLTESGLANCWLLEDAISTAANDCNIRQSPFVVQVGERRDAAIEVHITPDAMAAALSLKPPRGGKPASIEDVIRALTEAGIVFGIDEAALIQACQLGAVEQLSVASGLAPMDGADTVFEELVPQTVDRAPKVDADGLIDYREHGAITLVQPGAALMRRIPPTPGEEGHSVRGAVLAPHAGVDHPFAAGISGVQVSEADPNLLTAVIAGQPVRIPHGVMVEPVLQVAAVNLATGNISFDGTVKVAGDVIQGMKVQAKGDILVEGTVDGGLLEAQGNIVVQGGIIAHAVVRAVGAVSARFAQDSTVSAGTTIALDDMALQCQLQSMNQITIGNKAPQRGRLIGGATSAAMLLKVPLLGSSKGDLTRVVVGANPELERQFKELQERIEKEKANEENLQRLVKQLTAVGDPKGMLDRVRAAWRQAVQVWGKSLTDRGEMEKQLSRTRSAKLSIGVSVEGPVDLSFGSRAVRLRKEFGKGEFSVDSASLVVFTDPAGKAFPIA